MKQSHKAKLACFFIMLFLVSSCKTEKKNIPNSPIELIPTVFAENRGVNPLIVGIWKSIGNGYYLEARKDSILLYSYTQSYCYKEKNDYLEGLLNSQSKFYLRSDTLAIYLTDYGDETQFLQAKKDFLKVNKLPDSCISFYEMTQLPPKNQLELYRETLEENYAFKERRELDWEAIFAKYKDSLSSDENSLFETMGAIATLTKDHHTKVINEKGESRQYRITPSALDVQQAFENQTEVKDLNQYFNLFFETNYRNISDSLLEGKGKKVGNGQIEWGRINDDIGYIHIHSFSNFLSREYTRRQQIDSIKQYMNEIIRSFQDTKSIIVDVSFNFGGYDASALTIASYFTDEPVQAYTSQVYHNSTFYNEDVMMIQPADSITYTKPVYVLMTDISRSAAEGFGMMMGALPNVKLVGTPTLGILSGMLGKSISTFYTTYSNQRLLNEEGEYFEAMGLTPDIPMTVFSKEDVMNGHYLAVQKIMPSAQTLKVMTAKLGCSRYFYFFAFVLLAHEPAYFKGIREAFSVRREIPQGGRKRHQKSASDLTSEFRIANNCISFF